jgi:2',3'-cyclic-nucleotide 2'-phosphodiesterase (5'-nucleotidase family)
MEAPTLYAEFLVKALNRMEYDTLNLGDMEILSGPAVIRGMNEVANFPLISSNLSSGASLWEPYVIKEIDGVRVAVLGLLSPRYPIDERFVSVETPQTSLKQFMEDLKGKADVFVLLSNLNIKSTLDLVQEIPGIDVIVMSHKVKDFMDGKKVADTLVVGLGNKGENVGVIDMTWDLRQKGIINFVYESHPLDKNIPDDPGIIDLLQEYTQDINAWRDAEYKRKQMQSQEMKALIERGLKMTPEEFHKFFQEEMQKREDIRP